MLKLESIESALKGSIFAGNVHLAESTQSTNRDAMEGGRHGEPHGSVWLAEEQTAGRGRGDHRWHSAAGEGLYVSILVRPQSPAFQLALLPLAAGLAAADAIRSTTDLPIDLRWPNDLLVGPRKVGGILVESAAGFAVIGIGINVHQREFPADLDTPATSLDLEASARISRHTLLIALQHGIEHELEALADSEAASGIPIRIAQRSSWIIGRRVDVHGPQACSGVTAGLDEHGFLLVQTSSGLVTVQTGGIRAAGPSSSNMD